MKHLTLKIKDSLPGERSIDLSLGVSCQPGRLFCFGGAVEIKDLTGEKFTRLTVIKRSGYVSNGKKQKMIAWLCLCNCGKKVIIGNYSLTSGRTRSCGCLSVQKLRERNTTHGKTNHPLYTVWEKMRVRCGIVKGVSQKDKKYYLDRGITVCNEWSDFATFYKWAKDKWNSGLTIDRENNNGNYEASNCRFVPHKTNCQNTRGSSVWFVNGNKYNSSQDAATAIGVSRRTIAAWCKGLTRKQKVYPPKPGCYTEKKYA